MNLDNYESITDADFTLDDIDRDKPIVVDNTHSTKQVFGGLNKIIRELTKNIQSNAEKISELNAKLNRIGKIVQAEWIRENIDWEQGFTYDEDIPLEYYVTNGILKICADVTDEGEPRHGVPQYTSKQNTTQISLSMPNNSSEISGNGTVKGREKYDGVNYTYGNASVTLSLINNRSTFESKLHLHIEWAFDKHFTNHYPENFKANKLTLSYEFY